MKTFNAIKKRDKKFLDKKLTMGDYVAPPLPEK